MIKLLESIFAEQAENGLAAETTKRFSIENKRVVRAKLATMEAPAGGMAGGGF